MQGHVFEPGRHFLVRFATGDDIISGLTEFAIEHGIQTGWISYLGAISVASLRYYNQDEKRYEDFVIDEHLEVVSGVGNISLLDGKPFIHTHMAVADRQGKAFGGHVNEGTIVWALEANITELLGNPPVRLPDDVTGLGLWGGTL